MVKESSQDRVKKRYKEIHKIKKPPPNLLKNCFYAFVFGGVVSVLGQLLLYFFISIGFSPEKAGDPMVATLILLASLLTASGYYDNIGRIAGAGLAVPVTGFANAVTSDALEFKKEGLILGVGAKMFNLAGPVIVFGVITAFIIGIISTII